MNKGTVKSLSDKGFGFITVEGMVKDLFFHASALKGIRFEELRVGDQINFEEVQTTEKGTSAKGVTLE